VLGLGTITDAPAPTPTLSWQPEAPAAELDGYGHRQPEPAYEAATNGHDVGYGATDARDPGYGATNGHDAGYGATNGHDAGYGATNGHDAGYGVTNGRANGYDGHDGPANGFDLGRFGADAAAEPARPWERDEPTAAAPVFAVTEPVGYGEIAEAPTVPEVTEVLYEEPAAPAPVAELEPDDDADEVARQLAMLSPRAAQAVAAAAAADSDLERDAHLDALDDGDEPINRGLLLKFLSSVKS